ncbi:unnamed protein product [Ascophyllum nodosum]
MEKDALVPAALSFKVTDSILRDKHRQLDISKKRGANNLGWTPRRPPESYDSPISSCDDYFPTEEEGVTVSASSASPVDAGTGNVERDFVGSPNTRQGKQLSSNCASDDGAEVNVRKARGVPSAGGCRGTDGSFEPEAESTTRPRETLPLSPRSLAGVAASRGAPTGGFVLSSRSQDWSFAKIRSSGSGAAGGSKGRRRGLRFDSATAAAPLPPGVLPPGVQPPGVCPPGKLGGKDEYALLAAGNE